MKNRMKVLDITIIFSDSDKSLAGDKNVWSSQEDQLGFILSKPFVKSATERAVSESRGFELFKMFQDYFRGSTE